MDSINARWKNVAYGNNNFEGQEVWCVGEDWSEVGKVMPEELYDEARTIQRSGSLRIENASVKEGRGLTRV